MDIAKVLREKREQILEIASKYGAHNVRVFGSVARGESDERSDIDFLVYLEPDRTLVDWLKLMDDLEALLGKSVDVIEEDALKGRIREKILKEAVSL